MTHEINHDGHDGNDERDEILVTGGTGFVGSSIVKHLTGNHRIRLLVRPGERSVLPDNARIVEGDVTDPSALRGKLDGCTNVVHLVGIIEEHGEVTFDKVIRQGTENVLAAAQEAGISRFIHMSAMGARPDPRFPYHAAKFAAEEAVKRSGIDYTIFRPSVVFGEGDGFLTVLAGVINQFPITPIAGTGAARFQPIQVDDVGSAFARAVEDPATTSRQIYELGGGKSYTYEEMIDLIARKLGRSRPKVHVPLRLMKAVVAATSPLPRKLRPPVTSEQLKMLSLDNSTADSATAKLIGREPVALEDDIDYLLRI